MGGTQRSIYELIGGEKALVGVVDDFYLRVLADPRLRSFFAGVSIARLKSRQVEYFGEAFGGPHVYTGPSMREVHRGRGIGQEHFDLVSSHLGSALRSAGVPSRTIEAIMAVVAPLAPEIVSRSLTV
jgi:hemoglobin